MTADVKDIKTARRKRAEPKAAEDWERGLITSDKGAPKKAIANVLQVLSRHPAWSRVLAYDAFAETVVKLRPPPVREQDAPTTAAAGDWTEADSVRTAAWLASFAGFEPPVSMVGSAVTAMAEREMIHPVRDFLNEREWDGKNRAERLFVEYFGAPDSPYARAVSVRFLISAVARVMDPGCQADCMPVLEGLQGIRKSTGLEALFSKQWFSDSGIDVGSKDAYQSLRRKWCHEFGELDAFKGREVTRIKSFVSARCDNYRPSYGWRNRDFPRQIVFAGSTNEAEYLLDRTGNRRFWPVKCTSVDVDAIHRDRDQLWGEAKTRYDRGERWYLDTPDLVALAVAEQQEREQLDDWNTAVARWLASSPTVPDPDDPEARTRVDVSHGLTTLDVLIGALNMAPDKIEARHTARVGHVLRELGWEPRRIRNEVDWTKLERRYFRKE